jgi:1,4-dihydroxy-2-naphthoate octaprenyltransferase
MGSSVAWADGRFRFGAFAACLGAALLLQIGSNLANDVFDFERGSDTPERLGPTRVTQAGLLTPAQVKTGMAVVFGLAALVGLYLVWLGGWPIVIVGIASVLAAIAYTGGPFPLGYHGLGELFVFVFFGLASVAGTYYVQAESVSAAAWWMTLPPGLIITAILVVNNLRDVDEDRRGGKRTLAVRMGEAATKVEYLVLVIAAYLVLPLAAARGVVPWWTMLAWLSVPLAFRAGRVVVTRQGRPLNDALADTGKAALAFCLLTWAGMLVSSRV